MPHDTGRSPHPRAAARRGVLLAGALALCAAGSARAAESSTEARLREALRSASAQLSAAQDEKGRLQAQNEALRKEAEALKARLAAAVRPVRTSDKELGAVRAQLAEAAAQRDRLAETLAQCQKEASAAQAATAAREAERAEVAARLGPLNDRVSDCEGKNARLVTVSRELLARLARSRGGEPFLGLKQVEVENLAQDYEDRILDQKLQRP